MRFKRTTFLNISLNAVLFVLTGPLPALTKKPDTDTNVTLTSGHNNYIPLSESSNITTILQSWTMEFCGARSICYMRRPETVPCDDESLRKSCGLCYCDQCKHYGNCCADKFIGVTPFTDRITCEDYPVRFIMTQKPSQIRLVTKCPINRDPRLTALCEHPQHSQNKRELTPVFGEINQVTYLNEFCAECNGESKVKKWHLNYVFAWKKQALATIVTQLFNAEMSVLSYNFSDVYFTPPPGVRIPFCPLTQDIVSTCNKTGLWEKYDKTFDDLCTKNLPFSPSQTITIHAETRTDSNKVYRNVFCALCNGYMFKLLNSTCLNMHSEFTEVITPSVTTVSLTTDLKDFPHITGSSVVPNKEKRTENIIICEHRTVYDLFSEKCRPIRCTDSHYAYNYTCHPMYEVSRGVPYHIEMFYKLSASLQKTEFGSLSQDIIKSNLEKHEKLRMQGDTKIIYKFYTRKTSTMYGIKKEIKFRSRTLSKPEETESWLFDSMMELQWIDNSTEPVEHIKLSAINEVLFTHDLGENYTIIDHPDPSESEPFAGLSSDDYIELNILSKCKSDMVIVEYNETEYRVDIETNSVQIQNSGEVILLNKVVVTKERTLLVCRNFRGRSENFQQITNTIDSSTAAFYKFTLRQLENITNLIIPKTCGWGSLCNPYDSMKVEGPERTGYCAPCFCSNCVHHGDCCVDVYTEFTSDMRDKMAVWYTTCRAIEGTFNIKPRTGFLSVITTCPTHASANETQRCEESDLDTRYHMNSNMIFANSHCVQCHNYTQLIYANKRVECIWNPKITKWIVDGISWEAAKNSSICDVYNMPPSDFRKRPCNHNVTEVVTKCPGYKMDEMAVLCKSMYQPVSINKTIYWNIFCAICNGYTHTDDFAGIDKWNKPQYNPESLEYTVQLKNIKIDKNKEMRVGECLQCAYNQVYDTNNRECRNFYCHAMYSPTFGRCIERFHSIKGLPLTFSIFYILEHEFHSSHENISENFKNFNSDVLKEMPRYTYHETLTRIYTEKFSKKFEETRSPRAVEFRFSYVSGVEANYSTITKMKDTMLKVINKALYLPQGYMVSEHKFDKHIAKFDLVTSRAMASSSRHPKYSIGLHFGNNVKFIRIILEVIKCEAFLKLNQSEFSDLGNDSVQILGAQPIILTQDFDIINGTLYMCSPFKPISCEDTTTNNASMITQPTKVTLELRPSTAVKQTTTQTNSPQTPKKTTESTSHAAHVHAERKKYELSMIAILLAVYYL